MQRKKKRKTSEAGHRKEKKKKEKKEGGLDTSKSQAKERGPGSSDPSIAGKAVSGKKKKRTTPVNCG